MRLFGALSVTRVDGRDVPVKGDNRRPIMALLSLNAGKLVTTERIKEVVWPEDPRSDERITTLLERTVSDLRSVLGAKDAIVFRDSGYVLAITPDQVDIHHFDHAVRAAGQERDPAARRDALHAAVALWADDPLPGLNGNTFDVAREKLLRVKIEALRDRIDLDLKNGQHRAVLSELVDLVRNNPFEESLLQLLMLALHRSGKSREAGEEYDTFAERLLDVHNDIPRPETTELNRKIRVNDPEIAAPASPAADESSAPVPRLPRRAAGFVGRRRELDAITAAADRADMHATSLILVTGTAGMGKTSLAMRWASLNVDRFPDGQISVDLRGHSRAGLSLPTDEAVRSLLGQLGVHTSRMPGTPPERAAAYRDRVADRTLLIVLDNAVDVEQVRQLLPGTGDCVVIVTSRNRLMPLVSDDGARVVPVGPLSPQEATALLTERIGQDRLHHDAVATSAVLEFCAGHPLALTILAAHAQLNQTLPVSQLAEDLRLRGLGALDDDDGGSTSVSTVLSWSIAALPTEQVRLFVLLALAPGPDISLAAAANLTALPAERVRQLLSRLEVASLVERHAGDRFEIHDLVRRYGATRAVAAVHDSERTAAITRVLEFYLRTALAADRQLDVARRPIPLPSAAPTCQPLPMPDRIQALRWFDAEHRCLLAAQTEAEARQQDQFVWQLAWAMHTFHHRRGHRRDHLSTCEKGVAAADRLGEALAQTETCRMLCGVHARDGRHELALTYGERALAVAEQMNDPARQAAAHQMLAFCWGQRKHASTQDFRRAANHARSAHRLAVQLDDRRWAAQLLNAMGLYAAEGGDFSAAAQHCQQALATARSVGDRDCQAAALDSLGDIALRTGEHQQAVSYLRDARELLADLESTYALARTLQRLGRAQVALGELPEARAAWEEAAMLYQLQGLEEDAEQLRRRAAELAG